VAINAWAIIRMREHAFYSAKTYRIGDSVSALIRQIRTSMTRCVDVEMARHGLTDAQWGPLFLIGNGRGSTAAELAQLLEVDAGAMTRTLDRLERKGLLRRERCDEDRRRVNLGLTDEGERAVARVPEVLAWANNAHLAGFSDEEFATLNALLQRMLDNGRRLQSAPARAAPQGGLHRER